MDPTFLTWDEVLAQHADQLRRYSGTLGLRDEGLLRSALAQPEAAFGGRWLHADMAAMAAAYMFHIAQNHPFVDGNKRVAAACGLIFLALNGKRVVADRGALAQTELAVAEGRLGKDELAAWLRPRLTPWHPRR